MRLPLLFSAALVLPALAGAQTVGVRVENTLAIARRSETVEIPWAAVTQHVRGATPTHVRVLDAGTGREVVSQVVDDDGNGAPDALIFQSDFAPHETRAFTIESAAPAAAPDTARVFVMHTVPRDDIAWESDRIAYRMYGQGLWKVDSLLSSGVDVWVKRVRYPIVQKWYGKGHDSYHRDTGEGADFFDVGQSLGAGGTAIWRDGKMYPAANFKSYRILANGPIRATFELHYEPWDANGVRVSEVERISLDAGHNLNRAVAIFTTDAKNVTDLPYVAGLVKRPGVVGSESRAEPWAWLSEWGPVSPKDGGHGDLGIAVLLPRDRVTDWKETDTHYLAVTHATPGQPVVQYMGAGWTDSGDFRDVQDWWTYLQQEAQRIATPVKVTFTPATR